MMGWEQERGDMRSDCERNRTAGCLVPDYWGGTGEIMGV